MKTKYFNFLVLLIMCLTISLSHSQNILTDGDFSSTTEIIPLDENIPPSNVWAFWLNLDNSAEANPTVVSGVCNYQIINPGNNTWDVQLSQYGFPLIQGHSYELLFDVKADVARSFGVFLGEEGGNWTNLIGNGRYIQNATTDWQTIRLDFEAISVFDFHKLSFELGSINISMYFDNVILTDLGVQAHSIGILGSAANGWDVDVDMNTTDGINYNLLNYPLTEGAVKFRQDDSWNINWGGDTFPTGIAFLNGPNIPIPFATNYDIAFNRFTGEYSILCVSNCPASIGILGSALNGWSDDVDMQSSDGINYTLDNYSFTSGGVKFRQDDNWDINWGGDTFPTGIATLNGPNIPVTTGKYNVTFNSVTGDYSFTAPSVGILGSALGGWVSDIDMQSTDGINYTLDNYFFSTGEAKFRQDDNWDINWGGDTFPTGWAYFNGPNIPVLEGTYNVYFNTLTSAYNFVATSCTNPDIQCPNTIYVENSPGICGAYVNYPEVFPAVNCGGDGVSLTQTSGLPSGSFFPVGVTTNSFLLTNSTGDVATCNFNIIVLDTESPVISGVSDYFEPLWPPNHKMVQVPIDYSVIDNCGTTTAELFITSNEPENGLGDGDQTPDWEILDEHNVLLRAERSGNGTGREYYITIKSYDDSSCTSLDSHDLSVIFEEDFETTIDNTILDIPDWTNFSEIGDRLWTEQEFNGNGYAAFNSYNSGNDVNIGWLISPGIDMDAQDYKFLNFKTSQHHLTSADNTLEVFVSTDYDGSNVLAANWEPVSAELASLSDSWYEYIDSRIIDISSYSGTLYVAFKVVGSGTDSELDGGYFVDDFKVLACYNESGNYTEQQVIISVPHDKGNRTGESNRNRFVSKEFILYPNGVDDIINIKGLKTSPNPSYNIYDMFGIIKGTGTLNNSQIDVRTLRQGIYILKFETDKGLFFKKFIKN